MGVVAAKAMLAAVVAILDAANPVPVVTDVVVDMVNPVPNEAAHSVVPAVHLEVPNEAAHSVALMAHHVAVIDVKNDFIHYII